VGFQKRSVRHDTTTSDHDPSHVPTWLFPPEPSTAIFMSSLRWPDQLKVEDLQFYFNYLVQVRSLSPAICRVYLHGIRFLYLKVLHWAYFDITLVLPKRPQRIPELLTRQEVARLLSVAGNPQHQALLSVIVVKSAPA